MDPITKMDGKHSVLHARDGMGETFFLVSHDMEFVRDVCDRVAPVRGGRIVRMGPPADVLTKAGYNE